jgi:N-acetylglucosamine-6-phosphate deacetylase
VALKTYLTASIAYTPLEAIPNPVIVIEDGTIERVGSRTDIAIPGGAQHADFADAVIAPGFIDIHVHGGNGYDVMQDSESGLRAFESHLLKQGITSYCPTTVTASLDATLAALQRMEKSIRREHATGRAQPIGIHLEGPFISTEKCGVHPKKDIQPPSVELLQRFVDASANTVKLMTVAPELPLADGLIRAATRHGIRVSLGHSNARTTPTKEGIKAGATHATHTFNAMRPLDHRSPGILGVVLSDDRLTADIIADGVHVSPELVKLFLQAKGEERAVLITDAISATGMGDGTFKLGTFDVQVKGEMCLFGEKLAGSVLTMDRAVRNVMEFAKWDLQRAVRLATLNPRKVIGADRKGVLRQGADADLVVLTPAGEVVKTIVAGHFN